MVGERSQVTWSRGGDLDAPRRDAHKSTAGVDRRARPVFFGPTADLLVLPIVHQVRQGRLLSPAVDTQHLVVRALSASQQPRHVVRAITSRRGRSQPSGQSHDPSLATAGRPRRVVVGQPFELDGTNVQVALASEHGNVGGVLFSRVAPNLGVYVHEMGVLLEARRTSRGNAPSRQSGPAKRARPSPLDSASFPAKRFPQLSRQL